MSCLRGEHLVRFWFRSFLCFLVMTGFYIVYYPAGWYRVWSSAYGLVTRWPHGLPPEPEASLIASLPILVVGAGTGWLSAKYVASQIKPETRCRKCGYILRG